MFVKIRVIEGLIAVSPSFVVVSDQFIKNINNNDLFSKKKKETLFSKDIYRLIHCHRLEVAREETDVQDQQVSAKSAAVQGRRRAEQGVQSMVGVHGSRFHPEEVGPGETSNDNLHKICFTIVKKKNEQRKKQCSFERLTLQRSKES